MIEVLIDDQVIKVATELTIGKYQKIQSNPNKYKSHTEILGLYLDLSPVELKNLPVDQIKFVEGILSQHLLQEKTDQLTLTFECDGITYGLENDWSKLTWGQWVDLEVYSQPDTITDNIHKILAILYRPIIIEKGTKYTLEKFDYAKLEERSQLFQEKLPIHIWFGIGVFFLGILREYTERMETSLKVRTRIEKLTRPILKILPRFLHPKLLRDFTLI